jgi:hypothetical protein
MDIVSFPCSLVGDYRIDTCDIILTLFCNILAAHHPRAGRCAAGRLQRVR